MKGEREYGIRSDELQELACRDAKISSNGRHHLRMEHLTLMVGDSDSNPSRVPEDLMAAGLAGLYEAELAQDADGLIGGQAGCPLTHTVNSRVATLMDSGEGSA